MKKIMMMAVLAAAATTAFAQTAAQQAEEWGAKCEAEYQTFSKIYDEAQKSMVMKTPYDTLSMSNSLIKAFKYAYKCNEFDIQPNDKGKVKPKYQKKNRSRLMAARPQLVNAGLYFYNDRKDQASALEAWGLYVDAPTAPFFEGETFPEDKSMSEVAYFASLAAYNQKDYEKAVRYANVAMKDPAKVNDAQEILIFSQKDNCKTHADSVAYLNTLKDLHAKNPQNERFFGMMIDYYSKPWMAAEKKVWLDDEIAKNPQNKMVWALKGELLMNDEKWDDAVEAYKKAVEIDPQFVQVIFNIGISLNSKAIALKDQLADKATGRLTVENNNKILDVLKESKGYLEKLKDMDPNQEKTRWAYPLYQIYYSLGDEAKAAEMQSLLNK